MYRRTRIAWFLLIGCIVGVLILLRNPVNSKLLNLAYLLCMGGAWVSLLFLLWQRKYARYVLAFIPLLFALPFLLPGREINAMELRTDYVARMNNFENTPYFWGGENSRGIDCSGLPRRALRNALLAQGFKNANGYAFREYALHWWYDTSAKAMSEGYRDMTQALGIEGTVRAIDYSPLLPGDLAVTTNGIHVMAYAGDGNWIQADPGIGFVKTLDGKTADNQWFEVPVTLHRWKYFFNSTN
jgi:hypothetical protein